MLRNILSVVKLPNQKNVLEHIPDSIEQTVSRSIETHEYTPEKDSTKVQICLPKKPSLTMELLGTLSSRARYLVTLFVSKKQVHIVAFCMSIRDR